jgi:hypothetical protein
MVWKIAAHLGTSPVPAPTTNLPGGQTERKAWGGKTKTTSARESNDAIAANCALRFGWSLRSPETFPS